MTLVGRSPTEVIATFAVAAALVTALYLLRMRRRRLAVPFLALWTQVTRESEARRLWRRLRRILSWLLQVIVLGCLSLALGDPRPQAWLRAPTTVAVVIDASASMAGAADEPGASRWDLARRRAVAELATLGRTDRAAVLTAGSVVAVPGPLADPRLLVDCLADLEPTPGESAMPAALALAESLIDGEAGGRILIVTDGALDDAGLAALSSCREHTTTPCTTVTVGGPTANLAITAFAARRRPRDRERAEALIEVANLGDDDAEIELEIRADDVPLFRKPLSLAAGAKVREVITDLEAARDRLRANLVARGSTDLGPAADDQAWAVIAPVKAPRVALVGDTTDLFLEAALLALGADVEIVAVDPADADADPALLEAADIVMIDSDAGWFPATQARPTVVFSPHRRVGTGFPIARRNELSRPFVTEVDREHPLLRNVVLKDVNLAAATSFELEPGDRALVRSMGEPIVVLREQGPPLLALGFDPRRSDLPLRVAFPILIANVVGYFGLGDPGFVASATAGGRADVRLSQLGFPGEDVREIEAIAPDGVRTRVAVDDGRARIPATVLGVHRLRIADGPAAGLEREIAVNQADARASDLHPRNADDATTQQPPELEPAADLPGEHEPPWRLLSWLALGLVLAEWASYHRRGTV